MADLDLLLSVPVLAGAIEQYPSLTKPLPFTRLFEMGGKSSYDGDRYIFKKITNDRRLGAVRGPESEAFTATRPNEKVVEQGFIHTAEKEVIHPKELFLRSGPGELMRSNADDVVARAADRIISRLMRTREYVSSQLLTNSSGVALNKTNTAFLQKANSVVNTMTIDGSLQTLAMSAPWNTDSTKLFSDASNNQIPALHRTLEANGHQAFRIIISRAVAAAISGNIEAQLWLTTNGGMTIDTIRRSLEAIGRQGQGEDVFVPSVLSGLGGIPAWNVWDHGYTNRSGTFTRYLGDTVAVVVPEDLTDVLEFVEGPVFTPNLQQVIGDAKQAADLFSVRRGITLYAYRTVDDVGSIVIVGRDSFLPVVRNELGVLTATAVTA